MVLQRQMQVPIWGSADPNESVTVEFRGQTKTVTAGADGTWTVRLDPMEAGGPDALKIKGNNTLTFDDVLVGEVWIGSGQSNMQMGPKSYISTTTPPPMDRPDTPISGAGNLLKVVNAGPYPQVRIITSPGKTGWTESTPENLMIFSAQMQSFGIALQAELKIPVGLMVAAVGGTPSARWVSYDALKADPEVQAALAKAGATLQDPKEAAQEAAAQAAAPTPPPIPPPPPPTTNSTLSVAPPAPAASQPAPKPRILIIGDLHDTVLKPFIGYAMRGALWDQGESGTAIKAEQYQVMAVLIRSWRQEWNEGEFPFIYVQKPSGGGCSFDYSDPIYGWSANPFTPLPPAVPTGGGESRENFIKTAQNPNTFMVETSDLGDGIHPANKLAYGYRDAKVALGAVYHEPIEISGPVFSQAEVSGDKIRIHFTHVGKGLVFRNGDKLQGFALAGADKKWFWANATIDGDSVVVTSDQVPQPQFVRYAFAGNYPWANLFNLDGFPALPFRTDPHQ